MGALGGRSLDPVPFDGNELGEEFRTLHDPYPPAMIMGKFLLTVPQARTLLQPGLKPKLEMAKGMARYAARYQAAQGLRPRPVPHHGPVAHGPPAPLAHRAGRAAVARLAGRVVRRGGRARRRRARSPATARPMSDRGPSRRDGRRRRLRAQRRDAQEVPAGADRGELDRRQLRQHRRRHPRRRGRRRAARHRAHARGVVDAGDARARGRSTRTC